MFNQQEYVNSYIKENYKTIKLRIKFSDQVLINKINNEKNINQYLINLIKKDVYDNRVYNFINDNYKIDFELSNTMKDLIEKIEEADILDDYGLYMNYAYAIDAQAKKEVNNHVISESNWNRLLRRYSLWPK